MLTETQKFRSYMLVPGDCFFYRKQPQIILSIKYDNELNEFIFICLCQDGIKNLYCKSSELHPVIPNPNYNTIRHTIV